MTRSEYDLAYREIDLGVLNTHAIARTSGSGLYVTLTQDKTNPETGKVTSEHILLFPEQIESMIVLLTEMKAEAFKADHTRENVYRIIHEFHGIDGETADYIMIDAEENGEIEFYSATQKSADKPLCYRVTNVNDDEYFITLVTTP